MGNDDVAELLAEVREASTKELPLADFMALKGRLGRLEQEASTSDEERAEIQSARHRLIMATGNVEMGWDPDADD